jgi:hypothetical protein
MIIIILIAEIVLESKLETLQAQNQLLGAFTSSLMWQDLLELDITKYLGRMHAVHLQTCPSGAELLHAEGLLLRSGAGTSILASTTL